MTLAPAAEVAAELLALLVRRQATLAVAESLTGGLIGATITTVPGSSAAFRGGVVAYATDLKERLLGVPADLLAREGAVHPDVAAAMAAGVRALAGATYGLAVTGVAGPDPQDGRPVGTVHVAACGPGGEISHRDVRLSGSREQIRVKTVKEAVDLLLAVVQANMREHSG
ncbi:nicotinamide-nucleotide amidase [Thermocatellispora tengchongensis]|uniref:Nicotinamide-nucleotide amidase n=1 Tax=Thermocatellispora tengchongensis TaxID=1073253 RepID=A0A840P2D3_9ACTN|nr:nicotinamide-nucleotide amidohydrolase family protein [Thermocatellispora tengchongensis]MBB5133149.1 nicotinamide-nucleotide amidase [Thermocatellispora tengchongensis]